VALLGSVIVMGILIKDQAYQPAGVAGLGVLYFTVRLWMVLRRRPRPEDLP
jgi:hypothetical protein